MDKTLHIPMHEALSAHLLARLGQVDAAQLDTVLGHFEPVRAGRNQVLVAQGQVCRQVYFVVQGCVQVYTTDEQGAETTRDLVLEGGWVSELISFGTGQPATESLRATEPTQALAIGQAGFATMMETVPAFEKVYRQILEQSYANSVYRINSFMGMDARQRIAWVIQHRPGLLARLPGRLVASYLGISQETLSRLRAQL